MSRNLLIVNHINTFPHGGAAAAAMRLHQRMLLSKIDSRFLYSKTDRAKPKDGTFHKLEFHPAPRSRWLPQLGKRFQKSRQRRIYKLYDQHLADRSTDMEVFSMPSLPEATHLDWNAHESDIVHLHWIAFCADYPSFFSSIPDGVPLVWTMHDMNPMTGGCHYSGGCSRFQFGCGSCPQVANASKSDVSADGFRVKKRAYRNKNITVVTPSRWLGELAQTSTVWPDSTKFHVIRLGFDLEQFYPIKKQAARDQLGLKTESVLIGFGAEDINNQRKGFDLLLKALEQLKTRTPVECLVFGTGKIPESFSSLPDVHHFGYVDSAEKLTQFYSACDLVVVPSREDNSPQIGLEAMACGTPVVGFNAGGIAEYVRDQSTGLLAELGDSNELATKISWLVDHETARQKMGEKARLLMESEYEIGHQANKYVNLYCELLSSNSNRRAA